MASACAAAPRVDEAQIAIREGKISAPVRVAYRLLGDLAPGQPVSLELSFTPTVEGSALRFELPDAAGYVSHKQTRQLVQGKAQRGAAHFATVVLTPTTPDAGDIRVLVSIDVGDARYASFFRIPLQRSDKALRKNDKKRPRL